jgi:ABC-type transporter Mla MlaB component
VLRIERSTEGGVVRLTLSGRIEPEHLVGLEDLVGQEKRTRSLAIDLKEVTLVDRDAVAFLAQCESRGVTLENCPAYVREWIAREGSGPAKPRRKSRGRAAARRN